MDGLINQSISLISGYEAHTNSGKIEVNGHTEIDETERLYTDIVCFNEVFTNEML